MSVEISGSERVQYVKSELAKAGGISLEIPATTLDRISWVLGQDINVPPTQKQKERAARFWDSALRSAVERGLGITAYAVLRNGVEESARRIQKIDPGESGFFEDHVYIFGGDSGDIKVPQVKIRTMSEDVSGLEEEDFGLFGSTMFVGYLRGLGEDERDRRVLDHPYARHLRRSGKDEFPQIKKLGDERALVGIRAITKAELKALRRLWEVRNEPEMELSPLVVETLEEFPKAVATQHPRAGLFGIQNALGSKETMSMERLKAGLELMNRINLYVYVRVFGLAFLSRVVKQKGAR